MVSRAHKPPLFQGKAHRQLKTKSAKLAWNASATSSSSAAQLSSAIAAYRLRRHRRKRLVVCNKCYKTFFLMSVSLKNRQLDANMHVKQIELFNTIESFLSGLYTVCKYSSGNMHIYVKAYLIRKKTFIHTQISWHIGNANRIMK